MSFYNAPAGGRSAGKKIEFHGVNGGEEKELLRRSDSLYRFLFFPHPIFTAICPRSASPSYLRRFTQKFMSSAVAPAQRECSMNERGYATEGITIVAVPWRWNSANRVRSSSVKSDLFRFSKLRFDFFKHIPFAFKNKII